MNKLLHFQYIKEGSDNKRNISKIAEYRQNFLSQLKGSLLNKKCVKYNLSIKLLAKIFFLDNFC